MLAEYKSKYQFSNYTNMSLHITNFFTQKTTYQKDELNAEIMQRKFTLFINSR